MRKRRKNGEGSIWFNEKKNLWHAGVTTKEGNRATKSSKDQSVVLDWLNEQKLLIGRNRNVEPHSWTAQQWFEEWLLTYAKIKVKPRTYDRYFSLLKHFSPLYNKKLLKITTLDIQKIYNNMLEKYSPQTIIHAHVCLSSCLHQAVVNGLLPDNPAKNTTKPKRTKKEIEIFTKGEKEALLNEAENYRNSLIIHIVANTGLRLSEVLALRCEDIKDDRLTVSQSVHSSLSGIHYSTTKSLTSNRTIAIDKSLVQKIGEHKIQYGIREGLLFLNTKGTGETPNNYLRMVFQRIQKSTGISKGFHTFRHTHATELIAAGIPIHDVSRRLGHSKASFTLDVYTHFMPTADEQMRKALEEIQLSLQ